MTDSKKEEKEETQTETDVVGATESRLLQAMTMVEDEQPDSTALVDFTAYAGKELAAGVQKARMFDIVESIRTVCDPEIPINVYDMGLIYKIDQADSGDLFIDMTLTAPNCPAADFLVEDIRQKVGSVDGIETVNVNIVFEPEWTKDMMSEEAKLELGFI